MKIIPIYFLLVFIHLNIFAQEAKKIGLETILKLAQEKHKVSDLAETKQKAYELEAKSLSKIDNPIVSFGKGRLEYNGGAGLSTYDELSVSQRITINGSKSSLKKQARLLGEIAGIEGSQNKLSVSSAAILAGIRFFIAKEKFQHIEERRSFFILVSQFLKSRTFVSPQKQLELQLVENRLEEVILETNEVKSSLDLAQDILSLYIGKFSDASLDIHFLDNLKIKILAEKLAKKDLAETKIFYTKEKYFNVGVNAAKNKWIPDLQVYYSQSNERYSGGNRNQVLGLGVEVPIFNRGNNIKESLLAQKIAAGTDYEIHKSKFLSEKKIYLKNIEVGLKYMQTFNSKKISSKEASLKKFKNDFQKGLISAVNFLEFEDSVHTIHNRKLESQYEIYKGLLSLIELSADEPALKELF